MSDRWILEDQSSPGTEIYHLDGLAWFEVPLPRRTHRCRAQTSACMDGEYVERCACGAIRLSPQPLNRTDPWIERNSRRGRWMSDE